MGSVLLHLGQVILLSIDSGRLYTMSVWQTARVSIVAPSKLRPQPLVLLCMVRRRGFLSDASRLVTALEALIVSLRRQVIGLLRRQDRMGRTGPVISPPEQAVTPHASRCFRSALVPIQGRSWILS